MDASPRAAPFGWPVVPEVRITERARRRGGARLSSGAAEISPSRVGRVASALSCQARIRRGGSSTAATAPSATAVNSSSYTNTAGLSARNTSASWGAPNAVFR